MAVIHRPEIIIILMGHLNHSKCHDFLPIFQKMLTKSGALWQALRLGLSDQNMLACLLKVIKGKSLSEGLILAETNQQYVSRLF